MTTKTRSIRLETEMFEKIDEKCKGLGCNANDFIKEAINEKLNGSNHLVNESQAQKIEKKPQKVIIREPKPQVEVILDSEVKNHPNMIHFVYDRNGKFIDENGSGATMEIID